MFPPNMHKISIGFLEEFHYEPRKGLSKSDIVLPTNGGKTLWNRPD